MKKISSGKEICLRKKLRPLIPLYILLIFFVHLETKDFFSFSMNVFYFPFSFLVCLFMSFYVLFLYFNLYCFQSN